MHVAIFIILYLSGLGSERHRWLVTISGWCLVFWKWWPHTTHITTPPGLTMRSIPLTWLKRLATSHECACFITLWLFLFVGFYFFLTIVQVKERFSISLLDILLSLKAIGYSSFRISQCYRRKMFTVHNCPFMYFIHHHSTVDISFFFRSFFFFSWRVTLSCKQICYLKGAFLFSALACLTLACWFSRIPNRVSCFGSWCARNIWRDMTSTSWPPSICTLTSSSERLIAFDHKR